MDAAGNIAVGLIILLGLVGTLVPVLPGLFLVTGAVLVWALVERTGVAWGVAAAAVGVTAIGTFLKFAVPGRRLTASGVPGSTIWFAGALAIAGFFVIPVAGGPLGFVVGTYLAERRRVGPEAAGRSTSDSLKAVAMAIGIELAAGLSIAGLWLAAVVLA